MSEAQKSLDASRLLERIENGTFQWDLTPDRQARHSKVRESIFMHVDKDGRANRREKWDNFCSKYPLFAQETGIANTQKAVETGPSDTIEIEKIRRTMMKWKYQYSAKTVQASSKEYLEKGIAVRTKKHQAVYRAMRTLLSKPSGSNVEAAASFRAKVDKLIRDGTPPSYRGRIWAYCSGADLKMKISHKASARRKDGIDENDSKTLAYFEMLDGLKRGVLKVSPQHLIDIDKDVNRTVIVLEQGKKFPVELQRSLERVLIVYALRNPELGYCQGMSTLAALLLLHMDEERSFWVLSCIIEDMLPRFYGTDMIGIKTEAATFEFLVKTYLGKLYDCIVPLNVPIKPFAIKWFLCLYVNSIPLEIVLRVWDIFFHEGVKSLHRVGLSALYLQQDNILKWSSTKEFGHIYNGIDNATTECTNCTKLFNVMYGSFFVGKNFSSKLLLKIRRHVISNDFESFIADGSIYKKDGSKRLELETLQNVTPSAISGFNMQLNDKDQDSSGLSEDTSENNVSKRTQKKQNSWHDTA
eukprot:g1506.t1